MAPQVTRDLLTSDIRCFVELLSLPFSCFDEPVSSIHPADDSSPLDSHNKDKLERNSRIILATWRHRAAKFEDVELYFAACLHALPTTSSSDVEEEDGGNADPRLWRWTNFS